MGRKRNRNRLGAPRKYETERALRAAIERYLASISRTVQAKDMEGKPLLDDDGKPMELIQYIRPPEVSGMCAFLGIDRKTWNNYCNHKIHPEFADVTTQTRTLMEAYLAELSLSGTKAARGAQFNLTCNYGWKEQQSLELTGGTVEEYLQRMNNNGGGQEF